MDINILIFFPKIANDSFIFVSINSSTSERGLIKKCMQNWIDH